METMTGSLSNSDQTVLLFFGVLFVDFDFFVVKLNFRLVKFQTTLVELKIIIYIK